MKIKTYKLFSNVIKLLWILHLAINEVDMMLYFTLDALFCIISYKYNKINLILQYQLPREQTHQSLRLQSQKLGLESSSTLY